jgi:phytoene dehydrogenase-like protein
VLALPIFSYGAFQEGTVDSRVFSIIFRSLLIEGFGSPVDIKSLLDKLVDRFKALGGELQTRACVESVDTSDGKACGVRLTDGRVYQGKKILSSAGYLETGKLCGQSWGRPGTISVFQWMGAYEQPLESYGVKDTLNFVSRKSTFEWRIPGDRPWTDVFAFSAADNFQFPKPSHAHLKISTFSRAEEFRGLDPEQYKVRKQEYVDAFLKLIPEYYPGIAGVKPLAEDAFTPLTIERYTRHPGGTIYGGLDKTADGSTPVSNLYIIGNDQIGIGIIGAMASGILVSNHQLILAK